MKASQSHYTLASTDHEVSNNTRETEDADSLPHFFDCTCRARVRRLCEINTATGVDWDHPSRFGEERGSLAVEIYRALRRANPLRPPSLSLSPRAARALLDRDGLLRSLALPQYHLVFDGLRLKQIAGRVCQPPRRRFDCGFPRRACMRKLLRSERVSLSVGATGARNTGELYGLSPSF